MQGHQIDCVHRVEGIVLLIQLLTFDQFETIKG